MKKRHTAPFRAWWHERRMKLILLIGSAVLLAVGIVLCVFDDEMWWGWKTFVGTLVAAIFGLVFVISGILAIDASIDPDYQYQQDMVEYNTLIREEEVGYITFAQDVMEYNRKVNKYQRWHDNPFVNWFYYDGCENLPYYELNTER